MLEEAPPFWDRAVSATELRAILADVDSPRRLDYLAALLRESRPEEVWRWIAPGLVGAELERLGEEIDRLRLDEAGRHALGAAAHVRGDVHRSGALAELIEHVALTSATS